MVGVAVVAGGAVVVGGAMKFGVAVVIGGADDDVDGDVADSSAVIVVRFVAVTLRFVVVRFVDVTSLVARFAIDPRPPSMKNTRIAKRISIATTITPKFSISAAVSISVLFSGRLLYHQIHTVFLW